MVRRVDYLHYASREHGGMSERNRIMTTILGSCLALGLAATMSGCAVVGRQFADTWAVTYEVVVEGESTTELHDVSYLDAPGRGQDSAPVPAGTVATVNAVGTPQRASWKVESQVTAGQPAEITASAPAGTRISCRILLDREKAIASESEEAGGTITCRTTTPPFEKG